MYNKVYEELLLSILIEKSRDLEFYTAGIETEEGDLD
jgi:hypothetical protein